ncbi:MAG: hypothetical protein QGI86_20660 [Candidatus Poribacteria bacterium]|nr:hypothetical protein [Candidatus Poribacteria bacterium]MDP6749867.1 hypothetical protein [Candidatus Poribacteria bacterium]MDP6996800.1 hypothetical protein [Candidatus Poribacteria bacterium]
MQLNPNDSANLLKNSLTCQPRAFSPLGSTFSQTTTISLEIDRPANTTVKVYNIAGNLVNLIAH